MRNKVPPSPRLSETLAWPSRGELISEYQNHTWRTNPRCAQETLSIFTWGMCWYVIGPKGTAALQKNELSSSGCKAKLITSDVQYCVKSMLGPQQVTARCFDIWVSQTLQTWRRCPLAEWIYSALLFSSFCRCDGNGCAGPGNRPGYLHTNVHLCQLLV